MNRDWNNSLSGIYNACEYFIYFSNLWIPFERSPFKNISKEKTKDRYFLQSMIEASLFGFISEWSTMETKRGSIHVSLRATHFPSPPPESFPKDFHPDIRFLVSSRILSSFVCIFHGTILRTIVVPLQPSFRPGNCFPFPRWNLALGKFEGSSEPARRWFQRCLSERFNRWNCCTVWT